MKIDEYRQRKLELLASDRRRESCFECFQPQFSCFCSHIEKFDPRMKFVILIHPIERRRRIATGRMSHLCLENSDLILGENFSRDSKVNEILEDQSYYPVMLYPGINSVDISRVSAPERKSHFPSDKKLAVFVIDGTWNTARKMVRSTNLATLPRICFTPSQPSNFRVRKQPKEGCVSTIEAIHETIELVGDQFGFDVSLRKHDNLLKVFDSMVETQLRFVAEVKSSRQAISKISRLSKRSA